MKLNKTFRSLAAFVLALMLMLTMGALSAFAEADDSAAEDTTVESENSAVVDESGDAADGETVGDGATAEDPSDDASGETSDETSDDTDDGKDSKLGVGFWISMGILGALIIVGVVFAIIKREKLKVWLKSYKSELKKIVWMPWSQVRKNTVVVIVVVVALAAVIGLLDYAFSKGIIALGSLF